MTEPVHVMPNGPGSGPRWLSSSREQQRSDGRSQTSPTETENREHQAKDTGRVTHGGRRHRSTVSPAKQGDRLRLCLRVLRGLLSPRRRSEDARKPSRETRGGGPRGRTAAAQRLWPVCLGRDTRPGPAACLALAPRVREPHEAPASDADHRSRPPRRTSQDSEGQATRGTLLTPSATGSRVLLATCTWTPPAPRDVCLSPTAFPACRLWPAGHGAQGRPRRR